MQGKQPHLLNGYAAQRSYFAVGNIIPAFRYKVSKELSST
jgi:hypothetical protein